MQMMQRKQVVEKDGFCPEQSPLLFVFFLHLMPFFTVFLLSSTSDSPIRIMFYDSVMAVQKVFVQLCVSQAQLPLLFSIKYS